MASIHETHSGPRRPTSKECCAYRSATRSSAGRGPGNQPSNHNPHPAGAAAAMRIWINERYGLDRQGWVPTHCIGLYNRAERSE